MDDLRESSKDYCATADGNNLHHLRWGDWPSRRAALACYRVHGFPGPQMLGTWGTREFYGVSMSGCQSSRRFPSGSVIQAKWP